MSESDGSRAFRCCLCGVETGFSLILDMKYTAASGEEKILRFPSVFFCESCKPKAKE